jgi:hypothetical protein
MYPVYIILRRRRKTVRLPQRLPQFDEERTKSFIQKRETELQRLQNANQINGYNPLT